MMLPGAGRLKPALPSVSPSISASSDLESTDIRQVGAVGRGQKWSARGRKWCLGHVRYFDHMAILESLVAITSGIIVWLGMWDLLDNHILQNTWKTYVILIAVSLVALYANRTLYDKDLSRMRAIERQRRALLRLQQEAQALAGTSAPVAAPLDAQSPLLDPLKTAEVVVQIQRTDSASASLAGPAPEQASGLPSSIAPHDAPPAEHPKAGSGEGGATAGEPLHEGKDTMKRLYFDAPPFNIKSFVRSSFALLASLTLWIGVWDLLDYHIIPAVFTVCVNDQPGCAYVKAGCVSVGLTGLYFTRSLYGADTVKQAHFSRLS